MLRIDDIMSGYTGYESSFHYTEKQKAEAIYTKMEIVEEQTKVEQGTEFFVKKGAGLFAAPFSWVDTLTEIMSLVDEDYNPKKTLQPGDVGIIIMPSSYGDLNKTTNVFNEYWIGYT